MELVQYSVQRWTLLLAALITFGLIITLAVSYVTRFETKIMGNS